MRTDKKLEAIVKEFADSMRSANPIFVANAPWKRTLKMNDAWEKYVEYMQSKCKKYVKFERYMKVVYK